MMRRVLILGSGGAGKSTLARQLGERTDLPVIHLDSIFWKSGWVESRPEEFNAAHDALLSGERWIIDGNYSRTMEQRAAAADTVIVLDLPRRSCIAGILKRRLMNHGRTRPDMPAGCPEKMDWAFFCWVWNFRKRSRASQMAFVDGLRESKTVHVFTSRRQVRRWLAQLHPETTT